MFPNEDIRQCVCVCVCVLCICVTPYVCIHVVYRFGGRGEGVHCINNY